MRVPTALAAVLVVVSLTIAAADKPTVLSVPLTLKLGLWQMTYTTERNGVAIVHSIAPELLAKMSPDQRARSEARLKARAAQGSQVETRQFCLTEDRLKKTIFYNDSEANQAACQRIVLTATAKLQQFREECTGGGTKRALEGRFEAVDPDTMKGSLKVKAEGSNASLMNMEIAGKWVGADCGNEAQ